MADADYRTCTSATGSYTEGNPGNDGTCYTEDSSTADNLTSEHFRIVLYKECRFKGSHVLFDTSVLNETNSKSTNDSNATKIHNVVEHEGLGRLPEIIFGSTAMRYNDTYFKVHDLSHHHLIFTQVFSAHCGQKFRTLQSCGPMSNIATSVIMEEEVTNRGRTASPDMESFSKLRWLNNRNSTLSTDSGIGDQSFTSTLSSNFQLDRSSTGTIPAMTSLSLSNYGSYTSCTKQTQSSCSGNPRERFSRFGIAIIIYVASRSNYRDFYLKHLFYVQSILNRLKYYLFCTYNNPKFFFEVMSEISKASIQWLVHLADTITRKSICDTFDGNEMDTARKPRISFSRIINLFSFKSDVSNTIIERGKFELFCDTLDKLNSKENKFFLGTLLTATLSYHLGWVNTCITTSSSSSNSYNALRCQLLDLCGTMADIPRISKTVIFGSEELLVSKVLQFLSYFVRYRRVVKRNIQLDDSFEEIDAVNNICDRHFRSLKESDKHNQLFHNIEIMNETLEEELEDEIDYPMRDKSVVFILGEDEQLMNIASEEPLPDKDVKKTKKFGMSKKKSFATLNTLTFEEEEGSIAAMNISKKKSFASLTSLAVDEDTTNIHSKNIRCDANRYKKRRMKIVMFPLPKIKVIQDYNEVTSFERTLKNVSLHEFVPDMIVQGTVVPPENWESQLKCDVGMHNYYHFSDSSLEENAVVLGNVDKGDVEILSNKRSSINPSTFAEPVDASELVLTMLDVLQQMWKLKVPRKWCATFIEQRLLEICLRSSAMAEFLLSTDFCTIEVLTSSLNISTTDVPLLMSVASHIKPEISKKYGISYQ